MDEMPRPSEKFRQLLIQQELAMRKKQPEHWAKTKYRKFARPFTEQELEQIKENDAKRKVARKGKKSKKKQKKLKN